MTSSEPDPATAAPFPRERLTEILGEAEAALDRAETILARRLDSDHGAFAGQAGRSGWAGLG